MKAAWLCALMFAATAAAAPPLEVPYGQLRQAPYPPNFLLNLALTVDDAGAAYRDKYASGVDYAGYFDPGLCYSYPLKSAGNAPQQPDLDPRTGYFSPLKAADARHGCGGDSFSGNLMNWASASTLDLLRYGLTGGDRVIDEKGLTVLQRAWLPDGAAHADFYAHPVYFPRKWIGAADAAAATPFRAGTLFIVSCRNRILFSATSKGSSCDAPRFGAGNKRLVSDKYFGEFNVRVSVCGATDSAARPGLCQSYGSAFKPQGAMQQAAPGMRIGVMSYLSASTEPAPYGGALRVALGDIGAEFEPASGVARTPGAIDVVNRLGRSNPARTGSYAVGDPGAELYYEALRYLQARPPSVAAPGATDDGLPVADSRADPVLAACQRNIIATIGHPAFAGDRTVPGNTLALAGDTARDADTFAGPRFDVMQAARRVGEFEADPARKLGNPAPRADLLHLDTLGDGAGSFYLAGAAYWAHVNPVRPDKAIKVDSFSLELGAGAKAGSSALYLAAKYGAFDDRNADGNPFINSGEWSQDGAVPTHFYPALRPQAVADAVRALFAGAGPLRAEIAGPAALWRTREEAFIIQTSAGRASVRRHALAVSADGDVSIAANAAWDAAERLAGKPEARKIYTLADGAVPATLPFDWASLPAGLRKLLDADGRGEARTAYLRGERRRELGQSGGWFRKRDGVLGDVVHSVPLIVGAPPASVTGDGHEAYRKQAGGRGTTVYVGANDGMLHAFAAADGAELFAYVPRALVAALAGSADPAFLARPFVDGSAGQGDALINGRWRTVLVSGMGMGARGVFALDISAPAAFDQGMGALWEFTDKDDPAIGFVHAAPQIVKLNTAPPGKLPVYRYFAIVPSAINSLAADGNGALFLLALDKPAAQKWQAGVNYYRIATTGANAAQPNALSAPGLVTAADGSATLAYAGDLQGRLWRFDLAATSARLLFSARDDNGRAQPIVHAPKPVFAPGGGYLVLFGTGKLIEQADLLPASFSPQSMYAIHDRLKDPVGSRNALARRTLSGTASYAVAGERIDYFAPDAKRGWYADFPNSGGDGERAAASPATFGGTVLFDTVLPGADPCARPGARLYVLDALNGMVAGADGASGPAFVTGERAASSDLLPALLMELSVATGQRDATGSATATRSFTVIRGAAAKGAASKAHKVSVRFAARRMGWREVANWQELHDAATK
ncbi:MAG: PilC/PilY family type IV pilus protein [Pseudomonadota bacterium]